MTNSSSAALVALEGTVEKSSTTTTTGSRCWLLTPA
jgi:hypothetical protein